MSRIRQALKRLSLLIQYRYLRFRGRRYAKQYLGAVEDVSDAEKRDDFCYAELACPEIMLNRYALTATVKKAQCIKAKL